MNACSLWWTDDPRKIGALPVDITPFQPASHTNKKTCKQAATRREPIRVNAIPQPLSRSSTIHTTEKEKSTHFLHDQQSESSEWIVAEIPTFELSVLSLSLRSTPAKEIITRSPTRRIITITVPAPSPPLSTPSSLHTDEIHLILLIWEVVESRHSQGTDERFHPYRPNCVKEVVHHSSRAIARV